jgi:hypothetical protein
MYLNLISEHQLQEGKNNEETSSNKKHSDMFTTE